MTCLNKETNLCQIRISVLQTAQEQISDLSLPLTLNSPTHSLTQEWLSASTKMIEAGSHY